jgi:hypothetical protein
MDDSEKWPEPGMVVECGTPENARRLARRLSRPCAIAPRGWQCTRVAGHDGPCAAVETPVPWGYWHFLRHWFCLSKIDWFLHTNQHGDWLLGRCVECNRIVDQF